jgi:poly-beta-1,6-N-acetyl-D-glucosamine synthase
MSGYVLITAAHDEAAYIGRTCAAVLAQTVPPLKWVVVDDASRDATAAIVEGYRAAHPRLITLLRLRRPPGRDFRHKVRAFEHGLARVQGLNYSHVGNLDADITLAPDYYARMLAEFEREPRLGIVGGMVASCIGARYVPQQVAPDSVAGAVQLFSRACFEQIGGYRALPYGGIDAAAEILARRHGYLVRTLAEVQVQEHRRTGSATATPLAARRREGERMYSLGYGPAFFTLRCLRRALESPPVIGSLAALAGYAGAARRGDAWQLPADAVHFLRDEQRRKLRRLLLGGRLA